MSAASSLARTADVASLPGQATIAQHERAISAVPQHAREEHDQKAATFMVIVLAVWLVLGIVLTGIAVFVYA